MKRKPFELVLVNVRSRFNVGAMFRTADAVGITKIHLCGYTPGPPHKDISKVALGAERIVAYMRHRSTSSFLRTMKKRGFVLAAVERSGRSIPYHTFQRPKKPIALIMGNEVEGLPKSILQRCDVCLEIPMRGKKESLNVGIAFGIVAYRLAFP